MLAGVFYLSSGVGLGLFLYWRRAIGHSRAEAPVGRRDLAWLVVAIAAGGVLGPALLMTGLAAMSASEAALLLNLESVFTALLAWFGFREHVDARIATGMASITLGATVLAWGPAHGVTLERGAVFVAGACLAWAVDNNLTRKVSGSDPVRIAALKGTAAGTTNILIATTIRGAALPPPAELLAAGVVGLLGYGISLVLFVLALRHLGTGRTGAYFSTAPFLGSIAAVVLLREPVTVQLALAGMLMSVGVWLHLSERHEHKHTHQLTDHHHLHTHDEHHQHQHQADVQPGEPHSHPHRHPVLRHSHPHYPDLHHRHDHD